MLDTLAEKAACDSKKKKKAYSEAVVNTKECEKKPEEEKDMRGTYAKINLVKNKLRSMGQKDPYVMLADIDNEDKKKVDEGAYETVKTILDKGSEFIKTNPVGKVLGKIVEPVKGNKGKNYPTKADQDAKGLRTGS